MFVEQQTLEWKERYMIRAGVEATMSELKRGHGIGKLRVRGLARVTFAVLCKVTSCNIKRWAKVLSASPAALYGFLAHILSERLRYESDMRAQTKTGIFFGTSHFQAFEAIAD